MAKAKEKERKLAYYFYVEKMLPANTAADKSNVTPQTISKWIKDFGWKEQRNARLSQPKNRTDNIRRIINDLSEQRIELSGNLKEVEKAGDLEMATEYRKQIAGVDSAVANWNKTLETVEKETQISLSTYLSVMDMLFKSMRAFNEDLYLKTIDFQDIHLNEITLKFK